MSEYHPSESIGIDDLLAMLDRVRPSGAGWRASCPCTRNHKNGDRNPSLSVWMDGDRIALMCHRGCSFLEIVRELGMPTLDPERTKAIGNAENYAAPKVVAVYPYRDEDGNHLYDVCRTDPKGFYQRRRGPGGRGYVSGLSACRVVDARGHWRKVHPGSPGYETAIEVPEVRPVLFRLPELLATDPSEQVWIPEGEKDVLALVRLGFAATCAPMGAGKWFPERYSPYFRGRHAVVVVDNDEPGRKHATEVVGSLVLHGVESVAVVEPERFDERCKDAADVVQWMADLGHSEEEQVDRLMEMATHPRLRWSRG